MSHALHNFWTSVLRPMLSRPNRLQVAALCHREGDNGREVLLITSRDTGRWIVPKGWPMKDKTCGEAALQEAWEEAGVKEATIAPEPIGSYSYDKRLNNGAVEPLDTLVYLADVRELSNEYPERDQRKRKWFSPSEAAKRVREPGLKRILQAL